MPPKPTTDATRLGRPPSPIQRKQFNLTLPVALVEWLRKQAQENRRLLNVELEDIIAKAAGGHPWYDSTPPAEPPAEPKNHSPQPKKTVLSPRKAKLKARKEK